MLRSHHRGGECLGQALLSRCHGVKGKLIQLLGWERSRDSARGGQITARPDTSLHVCLVKPEGSDNEIELKY